MKKVICIVLMLLLCAPALASGLLEENFAILEALDIEIPDSARTAISQQIESTYATMPEDLRQKLGYTPDSFSDMADVLVMLGYGDYDPETWAYIPYTDDVYAFDAEMFDVQQSYTELVEAVERMSRGEVSVENVQVHLTEELFDAGSGSLPVDFQLNGRNYSYTAAFVYDWMDVEIIDFVNGILEEQGVAKRIWSMYDLGQGLILFYRDAAWAERFMDETGCELYMGSGTEDEADSLAGSLLDFFF